jgi:glycosyltransferase involved in cell wall biosynthesis
MTQTLEVVPISGLLPIKNGRSYLSDLQKVIDLSLSPADEMVIVDDHSTDETLEFLLAWAAINDRVHVFTNPGSGLVEALNFGISKSRNDWIARFDADDNYSVERLSKQRRLISPDVGVIFSDYQLTTAFGGQFGFIPTAVYSSPTKVSLAASQRTPHPISLINKKAFENVGGYLSEDFPVEDLSLWLRLANNYSLIGVPEELFQYRLSANSISAKFKDQMKIKRREIYQKYPIPYESYIECLTNWRGYFKEYELLKHSNIRKILYLHDLIAYAKISKPDLTETKGILSIVFYLMVRPIILYNGLFLILWKFKRLISKKY